MTKGKVYELLSELLLKARIRRAQRDNPAFTVFLYENYAPKQGRSNSG